MTGKWRLLLKGFFPVELLLSGPKNLFLELEKIFKVFFTFICDIFAVVRIALNGLFGFALTF